MYLKSLVSEARRHQECNPALETETKRLNTRRWTDGRNLGLDAHSDGVALRFRWESAEVRERKVPTEELTRLFGTSQTYLVNNNVGVGSFFLNRINSIRNKNARQDATNRVFVAVPTYER
jgi:hypothetical protein